MKKVFYLMCLLLIHSTANTQIKVGGNPTNINSASLLELEANNKGLVLPKVALNSATSPAPLPPGLLTGTVVYNTNPAAVNGSGQGLFVWSGSEWVAVGDKIKSDD